MAKRPSQLSFKNERVFCVRYTRHADTKVTSFECTEVFDVVAIIDSIVAQGVAEAPELIDDIAHRFISLRSVMKSCGSPISIFEKDGCSGFSR